MLVEETSPNDRLRAARRLKNWTQSELAEKLGTDFETVSRWERGITVPSPYYRRQLCKVLGKTAAELGFLSQMDESLPPLESPFVFFSSSYADADHELVSQCKAVLQARKMT